MKTGTCYFPSYGAALRYYRPYVGEPAYMGDTPHPRREKRAKNDEARALVDQKLNAGEIHIGKPRIKPGQRLMIEDSRWHIIEEDKATPNAELIAGFDSGEYDTEAMHIDDRHGNFSPDRAEEYRHTAIVTASLMNGQFSQARKQCAAFGLDYAEQRAAAGLNPFPS